MSDGIMNESKVQYPPGAEPPASMDDEVPMATDENYDPTANRKQGGICCGCCCDYRRAVIIISMVAIVMGVLSILSRAGNGREISSLDDDAVIDEVDAILYNYKSSFLILAFCQLLFTVCGLVGALKFKWILVACNIFYAFLNFILHIIVGAKQSREIMSVVEDNGIVNDEDTEAVIRFAAVFIYFVVGCCTIAWIYPSIFLVMEMRAGIMTPANYHREKHSCCCTSKK